MVLFLPSIRICSYSVPVFLLSIGFLTFLPIHLGKKRRSWWNRIGVCIPSLLAHCLMTGVVVCLAQMWFIKAVAFTPMMHPMTTTTTTTDTSSSSAPPLLSQAASSTESSSLSELPSFIWPNPVWPVSEWKRKQEEEMALMNSHGLRPLPAATGGNATMASAQPSRPSFSLPWSVCERDNSTRRHDDDDDDHLDNEEEEDEESWWSSKLRVDCLTDRAPQVVLCLMWINAVFFFLQTALIIFLNVVDTRAILVD